MIDFLNYLINGFLQGQIYALLALGFMVIYRASKVFNFAQGELMMLGAYSVWTLTLGADLSPWLAIPLAFAFAIAAAFFSFLSSLSATFLCPSATAAAFSAHTSTVNGEHARYLAKPQSIADMLLYHWNTFYNEPNDPNQTLLHLLHSSPVP